MSLHCLFFGFLAGVACTMFIHALVTSIAAMREEKRGHPRMWKDGDD